MLSDCRPCYMFLSLYAMPSDSAPSRSLFLVVAIAVLLASPGASGRGLVDLLDRARTGEPAFLSAGADVDIARARKDVAHAALLPQVSVSAAASKYDRNYHTRLPGFPDADDRYRSASQQLNVTQALIRVPELMAVRQSDHVLAQARHQHDGAEQALKLRLLTVWFDLLAARDNETFTTRQLLTLERQWDIVLRGNALGLYSGVQLQDARARLEQGRADAATARAELAVQRSQLELLTGPLTLERLPVLVEDAELDGLLTDNLDHWLELSASGNPALQAALSAFEAATAEVAKQRAGHLPTLELVASYSNNGQGAGGFPGQAGYDIRQGSVGLQLSMPLYTGGGQSARVHEAVAQRERARHDIELSRRQAVAEVSQAWLGWESARARVAAGRQTFDAARAALLQAQRGLARGVASDFEVLQAEQQVLAAQRDYHKGRYDQVVATMRMRASAGLLRDVDFSALDALLAEQSAPTAVAVRATAMETVR